MKRTLLFLLCLALLAALPGCGGGPARTETADGRAVDVDLTQLSSTMVYSEVYDMVFAPEDYVGKVIKMTGEFSLYESDGKRYCNCIVADATACCAQGLEFELTDDYVYPDDYPSPGAQITVLGTFDVYSEELNGYTYRYLVLRDAELL